MLRKINLLLATGFLLVFISSGYAQDGLRIQLPKILKAHCHCRLAPEQGSDIASVNNVLQNFGDIREYSGLFPMNDTNRGDCQSYCSTTAYEWFKNADKNALCKKRGNVGNGYLRAYGAVGTKDYKVGQTMELNCCLKPAVIKCPPNTQSQYEYDGTGRCKEQVGCQITPAPANGTPIGNNWGFFWDGFVIKFVPALFFQPKEIVSCSSLTSTPVKLNRIDDAPTNRTTTLSPTLTVQEPAVPTPSPEK